MPFAQQTLILQSNKDVFRSKDIVLSGELELNLGYKAYTGSILKTAR